MWVNGAAMIEISFGQFCLLPAQRLLLEGDKPIPLGSRAMEILVGLVERPGELVTKEELMARVWPNTFVDPANLTVHICALRKALRDGRDGNRYVINVPGRGYRFVMPIEVRGVTELACPHLVPTNLPAEVTPLIGRDDVVAALVTELARNRIVTVAGPGGIGKTSVALAAAARLLDEHEHGVWLVDLTSISDPALVPGALAQTLGLEMSAGDPPYRFIDALKSRRMLIVLDNCVHVVAAAAQLAAEVSKAARGVKILTTSREPLRIDGEHVYRLCPLDFPPDTESITAEAALCFPAVRLFVERAAAESNEFVLSDADAPCVAEICRAVDGIPLALEFAAARISAFGLRGLAMSLNTSLQLLTNGRRTALLKQQSLLSTFDWSYARLSKTEQNVLRRLAIFPGAFALRDATIVVSDCIRPPTETADLIAALVSKSMIMAAAGTSEPRFYLLETTRAYAFAKLAESGELDELRALHAGCFQEGCPPSRGRKCAQCDPLVRCNGWNPEPSTISAPEREPRRHQRG